MSRGKPKPSPVGNPGFDAGAGVDNRAAYLDRRERDTHCRIHRVALDATGFCDVAQAWWYPRFACPHCHAWLYDNGFCPSCTPKRQEFVGDYFEERWDDGAGREYGHYVRVHRGPTPVPDPAPYFAQLHALTQAIAQRQPGDESHLDEVPF